MKSKSINNCAELLAEEISTRRVYNVNEVKILIAMRFNDSLKEFINEHVSQNEKEYYDLLKQQANNKIGSSQYISMGYKLAASKHKKATSNRLQNEINQDSKYIKLKNFIIEKFGIEIFEEFIIKIEGSNQFNNSTN